jgi:tetratricopeptide (TPR) repeat protein
MSLVAPVFVSARWPAAIITFLCLTAFVGLPAEAQQDRVETDLRLGAEAMHRGKAGEAEKYFREVIQLAPQLADGYLDLGLALLKQGKLTDAVDSLQSALQRNPKATGACMFLGIAYFQMNRLDQARAALEQEIALSPDNAEALMWLGITELAAGNAEKAVAPLDKAAELSPQDINILDYRGRAHLLVSKDSYARMYALDPNSWRMHRLNAQIFAESNQHKEAIREYEAAIKLAPKQPDLYEELGDEYRKDGSLELAATAYKNELELTPHNAVALYDLGSVLVDQAKAQEGVPLLKEAVQTFAKPTVADYYLGRGLADLGSYAEAVDHLEKAAAGAPESEVALHAYYKLSQVYHKMQRPADARHALARFQKLQEQRSKQGAQQLADWKKMSSGASVEAPAPPRDSSPSQDKSSPRDKP